MRFLTRDESDRLSSSKAVAQRRGRVGRGEKPNLGKVEGRLLDRPGRGDSGTWAASLFSMVFHYLV